MNVLNFINTCTNYLAKPYIDELKFVCLSTAFSKFDWICLQHSRVHPL